LYYLEVCVARQWLEKLEGQFASIVALMEDEFDSHEFILKLAQAHQGLYVKALQPYADTVCPFRNVHREIGKRLLKYRQLVEKIGEVKSPDIFGDECSCARWRKVK
jgi:hypothetical protein